MRAAAHRAALRDPVPYAAEAAFAEAKAFLCSREARQMSESDLERELHRRGQKLVHKLLQGHLEQRSPREVAGPVEGADEEALEAHGDGGRRLHGRAVGAEPGGVAAEPHATTAGGEDPGRAVSPGGQTGLGERSNRSRGRGSPSRRWKPSARTPSRSSAGVALVEGAETQLDLVAASAAAYGVEVTAVLDIIHVASRSIPAPTTCRSTRRICTTTATARRTVPSPPASSKGRAGTWSATGWSRPAAPWRLVGAEAVLKRRALRASRVWDAYWDFHEAREYPRNHAQRYATG